MINKKVNFKLWFFANLQILLIYKLAFAIVWGVLDNSFGGIGYLIFLIPIYLLELCLINYFMLIFKIKNIGYEITLSIFFSLIFSLLSDDSFYYIIGLIILNSICRRFDFFRILVCEDNS